MKTTILLLAVLCCAYALPQEPRVDNLPSDFDERGKQAINALFDGLIQDKSPSEPLYKLLNKYRDILLAVGADRELTWGERHQKYSAEVFDAFEEFAGTFTDENKKNTLLSVLAVAREIAAKRDHDIVPDKAVLLSFIRQLFNVRNEGLLEINFKLLPNDKKEQEEFLVKLEAVLDYIFRQ